MCSINLLGVLSFILYILCRLGHCLVTLPKVEDNNIIYAESVIRTTLNSLFSNLGLKKVHNKPRLEQYSVAHNYFVSLTLQDHNSLKEIAKLARVVKSNLSDVTADYIALINEILDEDNVFKLQSIILGDDIRPENDTESERVKLDSLNKYHAGLKSKYTDINDEVLKILLQDGSLELNGTTAINKLTQEGNENVLDDLPIWYGDDVATSARRLYDAKQTKIKKFPFMASVQIFNKFMCAGSIIKSDLVITAASCLQLAWNNRFYRENPAFLSVRVGSSFYEVGGERIDVMEVYFHPGYNPKNLHNNLAVMRLVRMIKMKKKKRKVKKILLDDGEFNLPLNVRGIEILGWGAHTRSNGLYGPWEDKLRHATLSVYPLDDCQDIYSKEYVTFKHFCAGAVSVGSGACNRDVGGPGIMSGKLVGIISFGSPVCGKPDAPTVFTKVGVYYDWIEEIMEQDVPNTRHRTTSIPSTFPYAPPASAQYEWNLMPFLTTSKPNLNMDISLDVRNDKQFKDFLRTMFKSAEIEDYFNTMTPSAEPVIQTSMHLEVVQQTSVNQPEDKQLIMNQTTNLVQYLTNQDSVTPSLKNTDKLKGKIVFTSNIVNEPSKSSEKRLSSPSTAVTSNLSELGGINSVVVPDLQMEYNTDSASEIEHQNKYLLFDDIKKNQTNTFTTKNGMPIMFQTSAETQQMVFPDWMNGLRNKDAINDKIDDTLISLLHVSDSKTERIEEEPDMLKTFDKEERNNNQEKFIEPIAPVPLKDLTYRNTHQDKIKNLSNLFNNDIITNLLKEKIVGNIVDPSLELKENASEP